MILKYRKTKPISFWENSSQLRNFTFGEYHYTKSLDFNYLDCANNRDETHRGVSIKSVDLWHH